MTTSNADKKQPASESKAVQEEIVKIEIRLPSILGYEKIARGVAAALAEQIDLPLNRIEDLKTVVAEACMNAIEHGNNLQRAIHVTVVMFITADKLEVRVADVGHQTIPAILPEPGIDGSMRGWGMFFIKNLVDEMMINHLPEGGNEVRMVIRLASQDETPTEKTVLKVDDKPGAVMPLEAKANAVASVKAKPSAVQPVEQQPRAVTPSKDKPSAVTSVKAKPSAIQPAERQPSETNTETTNDAESSLPSES